MLIWDDSLGERHIWIQNPRRLVWKPCCTLCAPVLCIRFIRKVWLNLHSYNQIICGGRLNKNWSTGYSYVEYNDRVHTYTGLLKSKSLFYVWEVSQKFWLNIMWRFLWGLLKKQVYFKDFWKTWMVNTINYYFDTKTVIGEITVCLWMTVYVRGNPIELTRERVF